MNKIEFGLSQNQLQTTTMAACGRTQEKTNDYGSRSNQGSS